jgi:hypothetical protein
MHRSRVPRDGDAARLVVGEELEEHVGEAEERVRRLAVGGLQLLREREERAVREVVPVDEEELCIACGCVVENELLARQRLRGHAWTLVRPSRAAPARKRPSPGSVDVRRGWWNGNVRRVPLLSGSRVVHVPLGDDGVLLQPPPPPARVVDVRAAVRDALRFPLDEPPFTELRLPATARVTIVVEPPALPLPGAQADSRREALATVLDELTANGVRDERQTILVSGGLSASWASATWNGCYRHPRRGRFEVGSSSMTRPIPGSCQCTSETAPRHGLHLRSSMPTSSSS